MQHIIVWFIMSPNMCKLGVIVHWLVAYACQVPGRPSPIAKMDNNKCVHKIEHQQIGSFDLSSMMQRE